MKARALDWYKTIWTLDIKEHSWVEDTKNQVDFIIKTLELKGDERILDLACGYGRHSLELAKRGFDVTGVDITEIYIEDAKNVAKEKAIHTHFIHADIRELYFKNEFDVVLNLADGAVGYLESEEENLKIFDVISNALKPGGKHFMDVCNAEYAQRYFPCRKWETGQNSLALSQFEWDNQSRRMLYGGMDITYGDVLQTAEIEYGDSTRLYSLEELEAILGNRHMIVQNAYSNYYGKKASSDELQLMVFSVKDN